MVVFKKLFYKWLASKGLRIAIVNASDAYVNLSYSQEGEDLVLKRFFNDKRNGFYIDIGAHHPFRFSNTYIFYKQGWRGINVDAMPGSMEPFKHHRSRDINIEAAVSDEQVQLEYYIFTEKAYNTLDATEAEKKIKSGVTDVERIEKLQTRTLASILEEHLPPGQPIDFLSIDVEGLDMSILRSNNWSKYRPQVVLVEDLRGSVEEALNREVYHFMKANHYYLMSRTYNTLIFLREQ